MPSPAPTAEPPNPARLVHIVGAAICITSIFGYVGYFYGGLWWDIINSNKILQALIIPTVMGGIIYYVQGLVSYIYGNIRAQFLSTITISNKDKNYTAIVDYITKNCEVDDSSLLATTKKRKTSYRDWLNDLRGIKKKKAPEMSFRPNNNNTFHTFFYKNERILLNRNKEKTITVGYDRRPLDLETLTLSVWNSDNQVLKDLIKDSLEASFREETDEMSIYVSGDSWLGGWQKALTKKPRPRESVILDDTLADDLIADAKQFLKSAEWYSERGIPYRRGYLLYGPPGCGKTSFCQVLAGELNLDMCMLSLSSKDLNDTQLAENLREAPSNAILLLEDVDAVFVDRQIQETAGSSSVTFSGLLNAIDGVASQEGRMFFMTTNHREKLDPALIRPGRCDIQLEVSKASQDQLYRMFDRFFPNEHKKARAFSERLPPYELSMAQIQGFLMEHKNSASEALESVKKLLQANKPTKVAEMSVYTHLRRMGLEQYAAFFEFHGYTVVSHLKGFQLEALKSWCFDIVYDKIVWHRFESLFSDDKTVRAEVDSKHYGLADLSTIRDAFIAHYGSTIANEADEKQQQAKIFDPESDELPDIAMPGLRRMTSYLSGGLIRTESQLDPSEEKIEKLSQKFCEKLSRNGKGLVSLWQLRWLLSLYPGQPDVCVRNASILTRPREENSKAPQWLTTWDFCKRLCIPEAAHPLEQKFGVLAQSLKSVEESELTEAGIDGAHAKLLCRFFKNEDKDTNLMIGAHLVPRQRVVKELLIAMPQITIDQVNTFCNMVTHSNGTGKISLMQLEQHIKKYASPPVSNDNYSDSKDEKKMEYGPNIIIAKCLKELIEIEKPIPETPPPPPIPTEWVYSWLKEEKLERYADCFIGHHMSTKKDLSREPFLTDQVLEKVFDVKLLGDRRKIIRMQQDLVCQ